jgi:Zn-finger nucleic acid-binding protein
MNCKQCGAPLKVEEGRDFFHCGYCGSYDFPDPNLDGVTLLGQASPFACPVCSKTLVTAVVRGVPIHSCPNCRGNLVSQSKMLPILRQAQALDATLDQLHYPQPPAEHSRTLVCPSCQKKMAVYPYGGPGNVIIQGCETCRLIWLDFGELGRIVRSFVQTYQHPPDEMGAKRKTVEF